MVASKGKCRCKCTSIFGKALLLHSRCDSDRSSVQSNELLKAFKIMRSWPKLIAPGSKTIQFRFLYGSFVQCFHCGRQTAKLHESGMSLLLDESAPISCRYLQKQSEHAHDAATDSPDSGIPTPVSRTTSWTSRPRYTTSTNMPPPMVSTNSVSM